MFSEIALTKRVEAYMVGMDVTRILPPRDKESETVGTGVRLPKSLLARLDEIADDENYSRNEVIAHFLKWALEQYETEKKPKR